ncbi:mCG146096, partial [Mus musculus]
QGLICFFSTGKSLTQSLVNLIICFIACRRFSFLLYLKVTAVNYYWEIISIGIKSQKVLSPYHFKMLRYFCKRSLILKEWEKCWKF